MAQTGRAPLGSRLGFADDPTPRATKLVGVVLVHRHDELGRREHVLATVLERLADDLLRDAAGVDVGGVDEVDAGAESAVDDPDRVGFVLVDGARGRIPVRDRAPARPLRHRRGSSGDTGFDPAGSRRRGRRRLRLDRPPHFGAAGGRRSAGRALRPGAAAAARPIVPLRLFASRERGPAPASPAALFLSRRPGAPAPPAGRPAAGAAAPGPPARAGPDTLAECLRILLPARSAPASTPTR